MFLLRQDQEFETQKERYKIFWFLIMFSLSAFLLSAT